MQEVLQNDEKFSRVDRETVEAINLFAGTDIDIDEKDEVIDMCKAWEEQKNEGRELGREEGRELGREEGRELGREEGREEGRIRQAKVTALKPVSYTHLDVYKRQRLHRYIQTNHSHFLSRFFHQRRRRTLKILTRCLRYSVIVILSTSA